MSDSLKFEPIASHISEKFEKEKPLLSLGATEVMLDRLLKDLKPEISRLKPSPSKWSIAEIVAHLADAEMVMGFRFRQLLTQPEGGLIAAYDQDGWADSCGYNQVPLGESLEKFRSLRRSNLRLWGSLSYEQLIQAGVHPERGKATLADLLTLLANQDLNHLTQIFTILSENKCTRTENVLPASAAWKGRSKNSTGGRLHAKDARYP